ITVSPSSDTSYAVTVTDTNNCTAADTFAVTVSANSQTTVDTSICQGESYMAGGQMQTTGGTYYDTLNTTNGCDSVVMTNLSIDSIPTAAASSPDTVCRDTELSFTDQSSGNPVSWYWDLGDGDTASQPNPSHVYNASGTYKPQLIVTNAAGCVDTTSLQIEVVAIPKAKFVANNVCEGDTTTLTDQSTGNITTSTWDLGNGTTDSGNVVHVQYNAAGSYPVIHSVANAAGCVDTLLKAVLVDEVPQAGFQPKNACLGESISFDAGNGGADNYYWQWGDDAEAQGQTASHTYGSSGQYEVELVAESQAGCRDSATNPVTIYAQPDVNAGTDKTIKKGETVELAATGGATYQWTPAEGLSSPRQPTTQASPDESTTYVVNTTDTNGCQDTDSVFVEVEPIDGKIAVPNAFSPNDDGLNDTFKPLAKGLKDYNLLIFNRWGEKVFASHSLANGWDGTYKGKQQTPGTYVYTIYATFEDGTSKNLSGSVTLVR
ncbi:MAG: hypothetical protein BRD50_07425, partial [Bacteroidetes bacterium SW_11_45_7]